MILPRKDISFVVALQFLEALFRETVQVPLQIAHQNTSHVVVAPIGFLERVALGVPNRVGVGM